MEGARVGSASGSDGVSLLDTCDPVHLVLVRVDAATGDRELVSSTLLEWRAVLASEQRGDSDGVVGTSLELNGVGPENKVPVGVLTLRLQLVPKCVSVSFSVFFSAVAFAFACWLHSSGSNAHSSGPFESGMMEAMFDGNNVCNVLSRSTCTACRLTTPITNEVLLAQHALERQRQAERERLFLLYAKHWWREYLDIRPQHAQRFVKIFAQVSVMFYVTIQVPLFNISNH